ncbi:MAG: hypothetical protein GXP48_01265 [Acidobacteria bacterium]|nr:hypothetical protein [Acidobacteriota bacterium]
MKRWILIPAVLLLAALAQAAPPAGRLIILGFDGADAKLTEQWMAEGKLPHLAELAKIGGYARLDPTIPAQTPVSWSTFTTGRDPGGTRIFDFLVRNPETYMPSFAVVRETKAKFLWGRSNPVVLLGLGVVVGWLVFTLLIAVFRRKRAWLWAVVPALAVGAAGYWIGANWLPVQVPKVINNRQGTPFWQVAGEHGVTAIVGRIPVTFPARPFAGGHLLSGLGVPDVRGRIGSPTFYTSDPFYHLGQGNQFSIDVIHLKKVDGVIHTTIPGPPNRLFGRPPQINAPLTLAVSADAKSLTIDTGPQRATIKPGEWSPWMSVIFRFNPLIKIYAMARFRLLSLRPNVRLYLTSVQFDPDHLPAGFLISAPADWASILKREVGPYKTTGWAVDTWGVTEKVVNEDVFMEDVYNTESAYRKMLEHFLKGNERLLVQYFEFTDRVAHILFRFMDPGHPYYDATRAAKYQKAFLKTYQTMDSIVGETMAQLRPGDTLIVLSDHGFSSWRWSFNINTWLVKNGYLHLTGGGGKAQNLETLFDQGQFWPNVDWSRSRAYALGLGGLYINLRGREAQGIVAPGEEYENLRRELARKLEAIVDPKTGRHPIAKVYLREEIYHDFDPNLVPDMIVTTSEYYRISWQSALGGMPAHVFMDNMSPWSGDHCTMNPSVVQGILFANRPLERHEVHMIDVYPTILGLLHEQPPEKVAGVPFFHVSVKK